MTFAVFVEFIERVGLPIAIAGLLIWHFVHMNRALHAHNSKLASEIERLRSQFEAIVQLDSQGERLLQQNESLTKIVEAKDRDAQVLLRLLVEAQIGKGVVTRDGEVLP